MDVRRHSGTDSIRQLLVLASVLLVSSVSALAQQSSLGVEQGTSALAGGGASAGQAIDELRGFREKALNLDSASPDLLFPILGKIPGWQSDLMLINYRSTPQDVRIFFMQQGQNNASANPYTYTLPANFMTYWHDFFGTGLGINNGLGSIMIVGVNSAGNPDANARLDGSARLFQTNSAGGTLSQMFPAVPVQDAPAGARTTALGLRSDQRFRTNAGVVNLDSVARTFTVSIVSSSVSSFTISVPPYSMMQVRIPNDGSYGDIALQFTTNSSTWWSSYGASVDNISGDSWSAHGALAP